MLFLFFLALVSASWALPRNKEILRVIDASKSIVTVTLDITAENLDGSYNVIFPSELGDNLAFFRVKSGSKKLPVAEPSSDGIYTTFEVSTGSGKSKANLKVYAVFTNVLKAYPAEITQAMNQLVMYTDNTYVTTPYHTESQRTTVKLASKMIESYSKFEPVSQRGTTISYGPYLEVVEFSAEPMSIHYVNNKPFAEISKANREIEVSHWGNIAVEETYELKHVGAKLKGGFSRLEYQQRRAASAPYFTKLMAYLPSEAYNIYYRDQIGNISTSAIALENDELQMAIDTRFPMFGGWKTEFYIGYSVPASVALSVDDDDDSKFSLRFNFFTIFEDVWVNNQEIKVILPEGCSDIDVNVPYKIDEEESGRRFTFLDSQLNGGRSVITMRASNIVEDHDEQVVIKYSFEPKRIWVEPFILVSSFFAFFLVLTAIHSLTNRKTKPTEDPQKKSQ